MSRHVHTGRRGAVHYREDGTRIADIPTGLRGVAGSRMLEERPKYIEAENEHVIEDMNGSFIVLGRDRPGARDTGYGHEHGSSRIDLVVGRGAMNEVLGYTEPPGTPGRERQYIDPYFEGDAARIYISAKADIDAPAYFNIDPQRPGRPMVSRCRSAIGIKADAVRIIGREGIKLVTRPEPKNSMGGLITQVSGIDLIAGNDPSGLQPMVKGRNVWKVLKHIFDHVGSLSAVVDGILTQQLLLNAAISSHVHKQSGPGEPIFPLTYPSIELMPVAFSTMLEMVTQGTVALKLYRMSGKTLDLNYLSPAGDNYILSAYNNVN